MIEKYCYRNDPANCTTYGGLYQWNEAMQYSTTEGAQGICPSGWHIPTIGAEFTTLSNTVSGEANSLKAVGQGVNVGGYRGAGTNTSGFSALLAGDRNFNGNFNDLGDYTGFWSSTKIGVPYASYIPLYDYESRIFTSCDNYDTYGYNVRCIKDN